MADNEVVLTIDTPFDAARLNYGKIKIKNFSQSIRVKLIVKIAKQDALPGYFDEVQAYTPTLANGTAKFSILANTLENGYDYLAWAEVYNYDTGEKIGSTYDPDMISARLTGSIEITNIPSDGRIKNSSYRFIFEYNQPDDVPISSYLWTLSLEGDYGKYDRVQESDVIKVVDGKPPYVDIFNVDNLNPGQYSIGLTAFTPNSFIRNNLTEFTVSYTRPTITATINAVNNCAEGCIDVIANVTNATSFDIVKIKKRVKGETNWITLSETDMKNYYSKEFKIKDTMNASGIEYEYAVVGEKGAIESSPVIATVKSVFRNVFLYVPFASDPKKLEYYQLKYDANYSNNAKILKTGIHVPLGRKYPVVIKNGNLDYESGSVSATLVPESFIEKGIIKSNDFTSLKNKIKNFLSDGKPKVLKDSNGNIFLISIVDNISVEYLQGSGMMIPKIQFSWVQVGDVNNEKDLKNLNIL